MRANNIDLAEIETRASQSTWPNHHSTHSPVVPLL